MSDERSVLTAKRCLSYQIPSQDLLRYCTSILRLMRKAVHNEEWIVVLTQRPSKPTASSKPLVEAVGTRQFTLVAVVIAEPTEVSWGKRLYVGPGTWNQVSRVQRPLTYQTLTPDGQRVLRDTIAGIVTHDEPQVLECFNTTYLPGLTDHPLNLLPGLSSDCRDAIIRERKQRQFDDIDDLTYRVDCLSHPSTFVIRRVMTELQADEPYRWLTA